jgi:hypothetical protein
MKICLSSPPAHLCWPDRSRILPVPENLTDRVELGHGPEPRPVRPQSDLLAKVGAGLALASVPAGFLTAWLTASSNLGPVAGTAVVAAVTVPMLIGGLTMATSGSSGESCEGNNLADPGNPLSPMHPGSPLNPNNPLHFSP